MLRKKVSSLGYDANRNRLQLSGREEEFKPEAEGE